MLSFLCIDIWETSISHIDQEKYFALIMEIWSIFSYFVRRMHSMLPLNSPRGFLTLANQIFGCSSIEKINYLNISVKEVWNYTVGIWKRRSYCFIIRVFYTKSKGRCNCNRKPYWKYDFLLQHLAITIFGTIWHGRVVSDQVEHTVLLLPFTPSSPRSHL